MTINKIDISESGAEALDNFSAAMVSAFKSIDSDTKATAEVVKNLEDSLGIISDDVIDELTEIYDAIEKAEEPITELSDMLKRSAEAIRKYINEKI